MGSPEGPPALLSLHPALGATPRCSTCSAQPALWPGQGTYLQDLSRQIAHNALGRGLELGRSWAKGVREGPLPTGAPGSAKPQPETLTLCQSPAAPG